MREGRKPDIEPHPIEVQHELTTRETAKAVSKALVHISLGFWCPAPVKQVCRRESGIQIICGFLLRFVFTALAAALAAFYASYHSAFYAFYAFYASYAMRSMRSMRSMFDQSARFCT